LKGGFIAKDADENKDGSKACQVIDPSHVFVVGWCFKANE